MVISVEEVSASLVREYLSRKGLKRTIACMDEEHPRTDSSINNRSHLRQVLHIEGLYKLNKVQSSPLKTLLEIIVKHHSEGHEKYKLASGKSTSIFSISSTGKSPAETSDLNTEHNTADFLTSNQNETSSHVKELCHPPPPTSVMVSPDTDRLTNCTPTNSSADGAKDQNHQMPMASLQFSESLTCCELEKKTSITKNRSSRIRRGMMAGPVASTSQESNKKMQGRRVGVSQLLLRKEEENKPSRDGLPVADLHQKSLEKYLTEIRSTDHVGGRQELQSLPERLRRSENSFENVGQVKHKTTKVESLAQPDVDTSEMMLDDIDDLQEPSEVSFQRTIVVESYSGRPMDQHTASELKTVLLGSCLKCFSAEWRSQGFTFSETHDLRYGIVQKKGGPCGVLASVQAFVLKKLLFENVEYANGSLQRLRPSNSTRRECLVLAATDILWRAGEEKQATIAISTGRNAFSPAGRYRSEGVLEKITCFTVDTMKDLQLLVEQHIEQFETGLLGCLLLTISAVLSRTIEKVRTDMDVSTATLIGGHGYCTQELVNLLLCGQAVSNVFDNDMELDSGNGNTTLLKGIKGHCNVGLLSLFEHYNICKVGVYLKTPLFPIWVVCSESHFSVLFGLQRELLTNQDKDLDFDLYYYDGLANQQEEIRLTVSLGKNVSSRQDDTDLIPPLENCIRTRWKDASVSWNDTEPIL